MSQKEMNKKGKVDWSKIDGVSPKPKRLHFEKDETGSLYHCPTQMCDHGEFKIQRGCRKHVNTKDSWLFFFDEKPDLVGLVASTEELADRDKSSEITKNRQSIAFIFIFQRSGELLIME